MYIVKAYDGEGKLDKRMEVRPRHLEGMKELGAKVIMAGGLLDDEGKMKGSMLVLDMADVEEVEDYLKGEPYVMEEVWEKVEVERYNLVLLNPKED